MSDETPAQAGRGDDLAVTEARRLRTCAHLATVLAALLSCHVGHAQEPPNMLLNPSFEEVQNGKPVGWNMAGKAIGTAATGPAPDGQHWLRVTRTDEAPYCLALQRVVVKPNTGYRLRAWLRAEQATHFSLVAYDGVLNGIDSAATGWARFPQWTELSLDFRTRNQDTAVQVGLLCWGREAEWDAVRMWEDDSVKTGDISPTVNPPLAPTAEEQKRGFVVFTRGLEDFTSARYVPARAECISGAKPLALTCLPGEAETFVIGVHALRGLPGPVLSCQREGRGLRVDLFELGYSKRKLSDRSFIRYPLLLLPQGGGFKMWDGPPPAPLKAGDDALLAVRVTVDRAFRGSALALPMTLNGMPLQLTIRTPRVRLDPADISFFMYYADVYLEPAMATAPRQAAYYRDMAAHGMNSVSLYVQPEREEQGKFALDLHHNYNAKPDDVRHLLGLHERMAQMQAAGLLSPRRPVILLSSGGCVPGWGAFQSEQTVRGLMALQRARQWPPFLFYVADEPEDAERVAGVRDIFARLYSHLPEARTVTAIGDYGIAQVGKLYSVWIAANSSINAATMQRARAEGKELWAYDCNQRGQNPRFDRLACGAWAWSAGLKGLGQWGYYSRQSLGKHPDGTWAVPEDWDEWYMMTSERGPIGTVGWEGKREGIEDYRCLKTLERLCAGKTSAAARAGRALLAEVRRLAPPDGFGARPYDSRYTWEFDPAPQLTKAKLAALRERMLRLIGQLQ